MEREQRLKNAIAAGASILENRGQGRAAKLMRCDWRHYFPSDSFNNDQYNVIFEVPVKIYEVVRPEKDDLEGVISSAINEASGDDCELCFSATLNPKWVDYEKWRSSVFPCDETFKGFFDDVDIPFIKERWEKALERRVCDPDGAVTASGTLLECVYAHILDGFGIDSYEGKDVTDKYNMVKKVLKLSSEGEFSDDKEVNKKIRGILGSCNNIACGIGTLRNKLGDAHHSMKPSPRHASLAVNLAGAMAVFLLETLEDRKRRGHKQAED